MKSKVIILFFVVFALSLTIIIYLDYGSSQNNICTKNAMELDHIEKNNLVKDKIYCKDEVGELIVFNYTR